MRRAEILDRIQRLKPMLEARGVVRLALFGSYARDEARDDSDVDLLIAFAPDCTPDLFAFVGLKQQIEEALSLPVDLFTERSLHPALKGRIEAAAVDA